MHSAELPVGVTVMAMKGVLSPGLTRVLIQPEMSASQNALSLLSVKLQMWCLLLLFRWNQWMNRL